MQFKISSEFLDQVKAYISAQDDVALKELLVDLHHADVAEILDEVNTEEAAYLVLLLDSEQTSEAIMELDEDVREKLLDNLTPEEIADEVEEMDTDDAVDVIACLLYTSPSPRD